MTALRSVTAALLREPRQSTFDWILVGFGVSLLVLSIVGMFGDGTQGGIFGVGAEFVLLGVAFGLMGGAKLLPVERIRLADVLRFVTVVVFFAWLAALLLAG